MLKVYLDDMLHIKGNSFHDHINYLDAILKVLKNAGIQVNVKKSTWCAMTLDFSLFLDYSQ